MRGEVGMGFLDRELGRLSLSALAGRRNLRPLRGRDTSCVIRSVGSLRDPRLPSLIPSGSLGWSRREAVKEGSRGSRSAPTEHQHASMTPEGSKNHRALQSKYLGSYFTPARSSISISSSRNVRFRWCASWFSMYRRTSGMADGLSEKTA